MERQMKVQLNMNLYINHHNIQKGQKKKDSQPNKGRNKRINSSP